MNILIMKSLNYFILIFILFLSSFMLFGFSDSFTYQKEYNGIIEHLSFNTLIAFPEKALSFKNTNSSFFDETKITPNEFKNILTELYCNDYILININELFFIENDIVYTKKLTLPINKKPIILSFDNVSYHSDYQNTGEIDKIIIDRNNQLATYTTKRSIQDRICHDNEFIPILENFISEHPDFSHNSARGIIFLTGNNGILGYETNEKNANSKHELKRVSEVVSRLKSNGWIFGCNNYKYTNDDSLSDMEFIKNISLWQKEIKRIVGSTPLYTPPFGELSNSPAKTQTLIENGFRIFFTNSHKHILELDNNTIVMSRKFVSGNTLRNNSNSFEKLFNCENVYDYKNRTVPFHKLTQ